MALVLYTWMTQNEKRGWGPILFSSFLLFHTEDWNTWCHDPILYTYKCILSVSYDFVHIWVSAWVWVQAFYRGLDQFWAFNLKAQVWLVHVSNSEFRSVYTMDQPVSSHWFTYAKRCLCNPSICSIISMLVYDFGKLCFTLFICVAELYLDFSPRIFNFTFSTS